jgi:hypothetical protein
MPGFFNRVSILLYAEEMPCLQAMGSLVVNLPGMLLLILGNFNQPFQGSTFNTFNIMI